MDGMHARREHTELKGVMRDGMCDRSTLESK